MIFILYMIKKILLGILVVVLLGVLGLGVVVYRSYQSGALQKAVVERVTERIAGDDTRSSTPQTIDEQASLFKKLLGFDAPQTYLVLLLNNTELRPGGGFIGSYAVVRVENGVPHIEKVEGTEILDYSGYPENFSSVPPTAITTYLKVPRWYFRDANWSPDFASSAVKALELYRLQRGVAADRITGVIGITATTVRDLLALLGPVTVQGETFTAENVVEKLEYEVEIAFAEKGIERAKRKEILADLVRAVAQKMVTDVLTRWQEYFALAQRFLTEKQVVLYRVDPSEQAIVAQKGWGGAIMPYAGGDYLMWVDANLGALKTDAVMKRELTYSIAPSGTAYRAVATMRYTHTGGRDWKTSQYLTYIRVYTPPGTRLVAMRGIEKNAAGIITTTPDRGTDFGRAWFGGFARISPGSEARVSVEYMLAPGITESIKRGLYYGLFQKQIGTVEHTLTLNLDFGRKILSPVVSGARSVSVFTTSTAWTSDHYPEVRLESSN